MAFSGNKRKARGNDDDIEVIGSSSLDERLVMSQLPIVQAWSERSLGGDGSPITTVTNTPDFFRQSEHVQQSKSTSVSCRVSKGEAAAAAAAWRKA